MNEISDNNWSAMSDQALVRQIGKYVKHHRLKQNKSQELVSNKAGISRSTLSLLERGETVTLSTLIQVLRELDQLHIMEAFSIPNLVSPLLLAQMEQKKRQRSGSSRKKAHLKGTKKI